MFDPIYLMIEPERLVAWLGLSGVFATVLILFYRSDRRRQGATGYQTVNRHRHLQDAKDTIIMALLDDIATQAAAIEATDAAAAAKIDDLKVQLAHANEMFAAAEAAILAAQSDVNAANALAARLKAANDALQAKVAA